MVAFDMNGPTRAPTNQQAIKQHRMFDGGYAGGEGGVVWPGGCGITNAQRPCSRALRSQFAQGRQRSFRISEVRISEPIDGDQHDMLVGRSEKRRQAEEPNTQAGQPARKEKSSDGHYPKNVAQFYPEASR